ncbi:MAG TPA: ribose ABC transporter permease, partial [Vicinamibacteria bacterium]|nr:ribose ABC transporter permease [Vicinamibacteria bacterium]
MSLAAALARRGREVGTLLGLLALCLLLSVATPHFLTVSNLLNVMEQTAINAVIAVGMTFVILSGGIDLSVGSVLALSGVVLASVLREGAPVPVALAAAVVVGGACGLVNGLLITRGRLP